ncbi:MAG: multiheme c-type cytochrome [bacterium]
MPGKKHLIITSVLLVVLMAMLFPGQAFSTHQKKYKITDDFPFYPLLLQTLDNRPAYYIDFLPNLTCSMCHYKIYTQWRGSMHSLAYTDPYWQVMWRLCAKETKGRFNVYCAGCHATIGVLTRTMLSPKDATPNNPAIANIRFGVQCDVCHSIRGVTGEKAPIGRQGNASILFAPGNVKHGPFSDSPVVGHKSRYSPLHRSAEFCASCHSMFNPINNNPIVDTYKEWKGSVYAEKGIICQDCHMASIDNSIKVSQTLKRIYTPGVVAIGGPKRALARPHNFVGANYTVLEKMGFPKYGAMARKRLKHAALLALEVPPRVSSGKEVKFKVAVKNDKAGHNLPTGMNELRQVWLDIDVKDKNGQLLFHTGKLNKIGDIEPGTEMFNVKGYDSKGKLTYKIWKIASPKDTSIPPKATAFRNFSFSLPETGVEGPLKLKVVLRYRAFPQGFSDFLMGKRAFKLPIVDMVSSETTLKLAD